MLWAMGTGTLTAAYSFPSPQASRHLQGVPLLREWGSPFLGPPPLPPHLDPFGGLGMAGVPVLLPIWGVVRPLTQFFGVWTCLLCPLLP